jgi:hypothetical protein
MSNLSTIPSSTAANSETSSSTGTFGREEKVPTAEGRALSVKPSGDDNSNVSVNVHTLVTFCQHC